MILLQFMSVVFIKQIVLISVVKNLDNHRDTLYFCIFISMALHIVHDYVIVSLIIHSVHVCYSVIVTIEKARLE